MCSGYANLFQDLCLQSGVNAIVIDGYTKNSFVDICDTTYLPDHAWNKVEINGNWHNVDDTWDAGAMAYYKTTIIRMFASRITRGIVKPFIYKPHFVKMPQSYYFLAPENNFTVTHFPENSQLNSFATAFNATHFSADSAFYYFEDTLQNVQSTTSNSFYNTYASLDEIERDKNNGENAQLVNQKNYFGLSRFHYHNLFEEWEKYVDNPKAMKEDSLYLKRIITLSDSVLSNTYKNDSLIWEEYRDLSGKYRAKRHIQRDYTASYMRYLKRKERHRNRHLRKIRSKKNRTKTRKSNNNRRYGRLLWRHYTNPGSWAKIPKQEKADSLLVVFKSYNDSISQIADKVKSLQTQLAVHIDSLNAGIGQQKTYISKVTGHFYGMIFTRMAAVDDYDLILLERKAAFTPHGVSDSIIGLEARYRKVYKAMDSLYRIGRKYYTYTSRQRSVLKRIKRSTGNKVQYYSTSDVFRKNLNVNKNAVARIQASTKRQLKRLKKTTQTAAPIDFAISYCKTEREIALPLEIYKNKRRKHARDNKVLAKFAKRTRTKASSRLEVLRAGD